MARKQKLNIPKRTETTQERQQHWVDVYAAKDYALGIECTECKKWRRVNDYKEPDEVPEDFKCSMTKIGNQRGDCSIPSTLSEKDFTDTYVPGNIVWAKLSTYPWWPGIVEDNPDLEEYVWRESNKELYNVTFFGTKVSYAWININRIVAPVDENKKPPGKVAKRYQKELLIAIEQAKQAKAMNFKDRMQHFSMSSRYQGNWPKADDFDAVTSPASADESDSHSGSKPDSASNQSNRDNTSTPRSTTTGGATAISDAGIRGRKRGSTSQAAKKPRKEENKGRTQAKKPKREEIKPATQAKKPKREEIKPTTQAAKKPKREENKASTQARSSTSSQSSTSSKCSTSSSTHRSLCDFTHWSVERDSSSEDSNYSTVELSNSAENNSSELTEKNTSIYPSLINSESNSSLEQSVNIIQEEQIDGNNPIFHGYKIEMRRQVVSKS